MSISQNENDKDDISTEESSSISTDALRISPRPAVVPDEPQMQDLKPFPETDDTTNYQPNTVVHLNETVVYNRGEMKHPTIPKVPADWKLNKLILDLQKKITPDELSTIKIMLTGEIEHGVLERIKTLPDLFQIMRHRVMISRDNLLWLQAMLKELDRPELIRMTIDYARSLDNVLHFYPASEEPVNGYRYVKFHVAGIDFKTCTREYVSKLQRTVSEFLFVPPSFVIIAGVEPSSSMMITLMIPKLYVDVLESLIKETKAVPELCEMDIDTIAIGDVMYNIINNDASETKQTDKDQQEKFMNVYIQLKETKEKLTNADLHCLDLSKNLDKANETLKELEKILGAMRNDRDTYIGFDGVGFVKVLMHHFEKTRDQFFNEENEEEILIHRIRKKIKGNAALMTKINDSIESTFGKENDTDFMNEMEDVFNEQFPSSNVLTKCKNDLKCLWIRRSTSVNEAESCSDDTTNDSTQ